MNLKTILDAWIIANNPTEDQIVLSEQRLKICSECEYRKEIIKNINLLNVCTKCGCPIPKKVFTDIYDPCPLNKWSEVDLTYFKKQKQTKTIL